ncbi:amine sulfotransferase-like [Diretmus argenteus]
MDPSNMVVHKGYNFLSGLHDPDDLDQIHNLEIRDSDVFTVTYPKSGTIWMQQILRLLQAKGDVTANKDVLDITLVRWIEFTGNRKEFITAPSPRMRVTHLPHVFMPPALSQKKGKVIYVARNPKDVLVSYYHFHKVARVVETPTDFNDFFEKFLEGHVFANCWFDHIKTWYSHKDDMNMLFITYEEMIQDLQSVVERISLFLGMDLTDEERANVVKYSTFSNMKKIFGTSYENKLDEWFDRRKGSFLRKGTIGDWKNHFTVAQNEKFDQIFQKEMKDFPLSFVWDINDIVITHQSHDEDRNGDY